MPKVGCSYYRRVYKLQKSDVLYIRRREGDRMVEITFHGAAVMEVCLSPKVV